MAGAEEQQVGQAELCAQQGEGWQWCEYLEECVHSHVQACPAGGGDDNGMGGGTSDELAALDGLLSSTPVKVSVALICLVAVNEIAKRLLLRQEHARRQAEHEQLATSKSAPNTEAKAEKWDKVQEEHKKLAESAEAERREAERQAKLIEIGQKRKKYGLKDWKEANAVGGDRAQQDVRAQQVAEQEAAAPEREAALASQAERVKQAKLEAIQRQRKAYGLLPKGHALGADFANDRSPDAFEEAAEDRHLSITERQDAEYAAALAQDLQDQELAKAADGPRRKAAAAEPGPDVADVTSIRFRLPSGATVTRRFVLDDSTTTLFAFLASSDAPDEMRSLPLTPAAAATGMDGSPGGEVSVALWKAGIPRERVMRGDDASCASAGGTGTERDNTLRAAGLAGGAVLTVELLS